MTETEHKIQLNLKSLFGFLFGPEDGEFVADTIKNVLRFCLIGLAALGLQAYVIWMKQNGADQFVTALLTAVEYLLLIADVVWFVSRLAVSVYKSVISARAEIAQAKSSLTHHSTGPAQ